MDNQSKTVKAQAIKAQDDEIQKTKHDIKTRKELIAEHVESSQKWLDLQSAKDEVKRLQSELARDLASDGEYNDQLEDLAQLKEKLKKQIGVHGDKH